MEPITMFLWFVAGTVTVACLVAFWDEIKQWLDNVAADWVERHLGYNARTHMQKAVAMINRVMSKIKNKTIVYSKRNSTDLYFDKTTIIAEAPVSSIDDDVLEEIRKNKNQLVQEFIYK